MKKIEKSFKDNSAPDSSMLPLPNIKNRLPQTPTLTSISVASSDSDSTDDADDGGRKTPLEINSSASENEQRKETNQVFDTAHIPLRHSKPLPSTSSSESRASMTGVAIRRTKQRRSRASGIDNSDIIRPGKVAEILHRFSSTNRGAIRSVYYDSNSDSESFPWSPGGGALHDYRGGGDGVAEVSDNGEGDEDGIDYLSVMLDETLDDLEYAASASDEEN